jgi:hypothetical protein
MSTRPPTFPRFYAGENRSSRYRPAPAHPELRVGNRLEAGRFFEDIQESSRNRLGHAWHRLPVFRYSHVPVVRWRFMQELFPHRETRLDLSWRRWDVGSCDRAAARLANLILSVLLPPALPPLAGGGSQRVFSFCALSGWLRFFGTYSEHRK